MGGSVFQMGGASFLSGGVPHGGRASVVVCVCVCVCVWFQKNRKMGEGAMSPMPPSPLWETLSYGKLMKYTVSH